MMNAIIVRRETVSEIVVMIANIADTKLKFHSHEETQLFHYSPKIDHPHGESMATFKYSNNTAR